MPGESKQGIARRAGSAAFPRSGRLLRHSDFERVYKQGRRHFAASITVFYLDRDAAGLDKGSAAPGLRIGFTVGRALGGAVQRNRIKRRLREALRLRQPWPEANVDVVVNPKKVCLTTGFDALLNEVGQALVVIRKKLRSQGSSSAEKQVIQAGMPIRPCPEA